MKNGSREGGAIKMINVEGSETGEGCPLCPLWAASRGGGVHELLARANRLHSHPGAGAADEGVGGAGLGLPSLQVGLAAGGLAAVLALACTGAAKQEAGMRQQTRRRLLEAHPEQGNTSHITESSAMQLCLIPSRPARAALTQARVAVQALPQVVRK